MQMISHFPLSVHLNLSLLFCAARKRRIRDAGHSRHTTPPRNVRRRIVLFVLMCGRPLFLLSQELVVLLPSLGVAAI